MTIQKIFHMNQSVGETQRRLRNIGSYRRHLDGVDLARSNANGISHWKLRLQLGFGLDVELEELKGSAENTLLFRSVGGNVDLFGSITFQEVKRGLTEIEFVVDYRSSSRLFSVLDQMLSIGDHFVVNQLRRVRAHFEGIAAPTAARTVPFFDQTLARA